MTFPRESCHQQLYFKEICFLQLAILVEHQSKKDILRFNKKAISSFSSFFLLSLLFKNMRREKKSYNKFEKGMCFFISNAARLTSPDYCFLFLSPSFFFFHFIKIGCGKKNYFSAETKRKFFFFATKVNFFLM